jgi:hypothetical protein
MEPSFSYKPRAVAKPNFFLRIEILPMRLCLC